MGWHYHEDSEKMVFFAGHPSNLSDSDGKLLSEEEIKAEFGEDSGYVTTSAKWEVCGVCHGEGSTVHGWGGDNGDYHVMTESDRDEDPEYYEDVIRGKYNRPCPECRGKRVVKGPVLSELTKEEREWVKQEEREEDYYRSISEAERRFGC